ncbi:MAG: serine hydrolase [Chlorobi bacterium]|nr:serine hydrolase [Chlorobiota bacterium]
MSKENQNRTRKVISIFLLVLFIIWSFSPYYLKKALIHWYPGIDDYEIFENRTVKASDSPVPWAKAKNYNKPELSKTLKDTLENYESVAFVVIRNDSLLIEKYWDNYGPDSYSNSFSMAKSIVSLLIGAAIDEGKIGSVDDPVYRYLPHLNEGKSRDLTIRDLLTMSSGSNWDESYNSPLSMTTEAYYGNNLPELAKRIHVVDQPGKQFSYKSGDSQLLGLLIRNATGKTLSEYCSEKLWQPIGAVNDALWSLDRKDGYEKAYCCFNSNALDFARFGKLMLNKGRFDDKQIIPERYITKAMSPASYLTDNSGKPVDFYGYQFWIMHDGGKSYPYMRGILGQYIIAVPEKNAIIVRLGHKRSKSYNGHHPWDAYTYLKEGLKLLK